MKKSLFLLMLFLSGCALFKKVPLIEPPQMVLVKGGTFMMGDIFEYNNADALPVHEVTMPDFYIGRYEVTYDEYDQFAAATNRELPPDDGHGRGNRAVVYVNWDDALAYCRYFGYRLPSEAEWEYAARAGGKPFLYSGTSNPDSLKYYSISESRHSFYVGAKKPNLLGLYDMSGNVFEWIGEYYQYYKNPDELHDLENSKMRIIRGGSFSSSYSGSIQQTYRRVGVLNLTGESDLGFRCAASANEIKKD